MTLSATVTLVGADAIVSKVTEVANPLSYISAMNKAVRLVKDDMQRYPSKAQGSFTRLATAGQRRAFWAKVHSGEARIDGQGYVRQGKLKQGWQTRIEQAPNGLNGIAFNSLRWSMYVQGDNAQQPFHKASRFLTPDKEIKKRKNDILKLFQVEARRELNE